MAVIEGSPQGLSVVHGEYRFDSFKVTNTKEDRIYWRHRIFPIYRDFDKDPFLGPDEVESYVQRGIYIDIVRKNGQELHESKREILDTARDDPASHPDDVAYVVYQLKDATVAGSPTRVLNILSKVVLGDHQKHGIGTDLTKIMLARHQPQALTAETGNPYAYLAHQRSGYVGVGYALDTRFEGDMFQGMKMALGERLFNNIDNFPTGLCEENYPRTPGMMRRRQIFDIVEEEDNTNVVILREEDNTDAFRILKGWKDLGLQPRRRDEMRYWFLVNSCEVPTIEALQEQFSDEVLQAA